MILPLTHATRAEMATLPRSAIAFAAVALGVAIAAVVLAGWFPIGFSIITVFLFAGPHNWFEVRYFLSRLPGRWGRLHGFFLIAFAGVLGLTAVYGCLVLAGQFGLADSSTWLTALAIWNTLLVAWIAILIHLRSRQNPRRDWAWTGPLAFVLIALAWLAPLTWGLALVYLHPLVALWILDRELKRSRPAWRGAYHICLAIVPFLLGLLWWRLASTPDLPGDDVLTRAITWHAGGGVLAGVSTHLLVATHSFLELLHYGVWLVAIPLVGIRTLPWRLDAVPLVRRSSTWRLALGGMLVLGACVVVLLWAAFLADYPTTRDVYFTVAMLHVLAEVPFLLRAL